MAWFGKGNQDDFEPTQEALLDSSVRVSNKPAWQGTKANKKERADSMKTEDITTILGRGSEFEGKLDFEGTLRIEGKFKGEIHSDAVLRVDEGALVEAEIEVGTIIISGVVKGNVVAKESVEIHRPGKFYGSLQTPALTVEKGVVLEGTCKMENLGSGSVFSKDKDKAKPKDNNNKHQDPKPSAQA